jgi:hypothetical protein
VDAVALNKDWTLRVWTGAVREKPQPRAILPLVVPGIEEPSAEA